MKFKTAFLMGILLGFSLVSHAQAQIETIYLIPSDQSEDNSKIKVLNNMVRDVQLFYAGEMDRHGFGQKTFEYTNVRVHNGRHTLAEYLSDRNLVWFELGRTTWLPEYLADIVFMEGIDAFDNGATAGKTLPLNWDKGAYFLVWIPIKDTQWMTPVVAHELGHVFGLSHTDTLVMDGKRTIMSGASRIREINKYTISFNEAKILDKSTFLSVVPTNDPESVKPDKILGPWLWMIVPTEIGQGGADSTDIDSLNIESGGNTSEKEIATNGAVPGDIVGDKVWTLGELTDSSDNITNLINAIGLGRGDINNHSAYALIILISNGQQNNVTMRAGSDDSIKIWLNGKVVHKNAINRPSVDFQDTFTVNLIDGENLLMVKVSELYGGWGMYIGLESEFSLGSFESNKFKFDVNNDGYVDLSDVLIVRSAIKNRKSYNTDINGDGITNEIDVLLVKQKAMEAIVAAAPSLIRRKKITTWGALKHK